MLSRGILGLERIRELILLVRVRSLLGAISRVRQDGSRSRIPRYQKDELVVEKGVDERHCDRNIEVGEEGEEGCIACSTSRNHTSTILAFLQPSYLLHYRSYDGFLRTPLGPSTEHPAVDADIRLPPYPTNHFEMLALIRRSNSNLARLPTLF